MAKLDEYRRKRDPKRTPEPFDDRTPGGDRPRFVVQEPASSRG